MQIVNKTEPYYIRCVKPNDDKRANMFDTKMSLEQLTYAGVFEAVKIRKSGFPFRLLHRAFVARYRCLAKGRTQIPVKGGDDRELAKKIMGCLPQDFSNVQIGNTMVLYRAEEHRILELLRNLSLELIVPVAQRGSRRGLGRKYLRKLREAKKTCKDAVALGNDAAALDRAIKKTNDLLGPMRKLFSHEPKELSEAKELRHKLQERVEVRVCEERSDELRRRMYVAAANFYAVSNITNAPSFTNHASLVTVDQDHGRSDRQGPHERLPRARVRHRPRQQDQGHCGHRRGDGDRGQVQGDAQELCRA